ncbi:MAG TPA: Ig-like domain-containing protein, partial [Spirochaetota bacterium]
MYPGGLVSLTVPQSIPTGVSPNNPGIAIIFSRAMENDSGEMTFSLELLDGSTAKPYTLSPSSVSSHSFSMKPLAPLLENHTYTIRIFNTAYEDDHPTHTLDFSNLTTTANPLTTTDYVDYQFTTGATTPADVTAPTFVSSIPANGATGIFTFLGVGYIQFILNDNISPKIDPSTVNNTTVTLYNTDDVIQVSGFVECDTADATLGTYRFYPGIVLENSKNYRLRISVSGSVKDFSGNVLPQTDIAFQTMAVNAPIVLFSSIDAVTSNSVTISWITSALSISHADLKIGSAYSPPADFTFHDSPLTLVHSCTITGITANALYSVRISADGSGSTPSGGPFAATQDYPGAFHSIPDTIEGSTGNFKLSETAGTKSSLTFVQIDQDNSFIFWKDSATADIRGQYIHSDSVSSPKIWDQWPSTGANTGVQIFSATGSITAIDNGTGGTIVTRVDGSNVYAASVYNAAGSPAYNWGGGGPGTTIYSGSASEARAALSYAGYASVVATGSANTNFIYDSSSPFGSVLANNYVINEGANNFSTVTTKFGPDFIVLGTNILTPALKNYRIGNNLSTKIGNETATSAGLTMFTDNPLFVAGDIITNGVNYTYLTTATSDPVSPFSYTTGINSAFALSNALTTYAYITNGTAETNSLYSPLTNFSVAGAAPNDIVINTNAATGGGSDLVSSISGSSNNLLLLSDSSKYLFPAVNTFSLLRLPSSADFISSGRVTAIPGVNQITQTGATGIAVGDILYNVAANTYATVTATAPITLSSQIFATGNTFLVLRYNLVTFAWINGTTIYGASGRRSTGAVPTGFVTFTIVSGNTYR